MERATTCTQISSSKFADWFGVVEAARGEVDLLLSRAGRQVADTLFAQGDTVTACWHDLGPAAR